jgi:LPS export ABC transporter protein LptC
MRWQRIARLAIAVFVVVFAIVVIGQLRRPTRPAVTSQTPRVDQKTVAEIGEFTHTITDDETGKVRYRIDGKRMLTYPDGRQIVDNAVVTMPDRDGHTMKLHGGAMELVMPQNSKQPQTVVVTKGARLTSDDGLEVTSDRANYDDRTGVVTIPGPVQFTKGRLHGSGVGATYDKGRNVIWLLDQATLHVKPDEKGAGAADATAKGIGMARSEHFVRLVENAHIVGEGRTLDANEIVLRLLPDDSTLQSVEMRGNSRIVGTGAASTADTMSARDIDLTYAPDGRTLQQARLVENAVAQFGADGGSRRISATTIDMMMGPDGSINGLNANQNVALDLPASGDAPARRITAATLNGQGPDGLQTATFAGGVVYRELKPPPKRGAPPPSERTARSQRLIVQTQPGLGALQQADFRGNVHIEDGDTVADAPRAVHQVAQDSFDLSLSPGDPGPQPSLNDGRVLVYARTINFTIGTKKLRAETDVRSSVQPARGDADKKGASPAAAKGRGAAADAGKMPSMLAQDQPVNVTAAKMDYDGAASLATYTGQAKLWQDQTQVQGDVIVVDDRSGNLTARGHVRSVMFFDEVDAKTGKKQSVQTTATGDSLVYEDAKRIATYTSGATAQAHLVGSEGDVTADQIQLFLKQGSKELDRAEAEGKVTVVEGFRTATGQHLTYTPANETYVMTGAPVEIVEKMPNECRISNATTLTFRKAAEAMTMENNRYAPVKFRQCPAK